MGWYRTGGGTDTSDANATASDILISKTAYVNDEKITGTMANLGDISHTIGAGEVYTVNAGYTSGGTITAIAAGATITVTYDSRFYNKTMTCTKGQTTYTQTTTSSGSTTFSVAEGGTWTITCDGVSRTVDVVLEYTTQMAITKTVTVYSAASDTVSFTDITGAKTVTTNTNGQGSVSITFIPNSTITFTSSIAKNPSNLSQAYSKTITMTDSIETIKVMPNNVMYWYGYNNNTVAVTSSMIAGYTWTPAPTFNTNNISIASTTYTHCGITSNVPTNNNTKIKAILKANAPQSGGATQLSAGADYAHYNNYGSATLTHDSTIRFVEFSTSSGGGIILIDSFGGASSVLYAIWAE